MQRVIQLVLFLLLLLGPAWAQAAEDPYAGGKMARLAKQIWDHSDEGGGNIPPEVAKALEEFLTGKWKYIAVVDLLRGEKLSAEEKKFFLDKWVLTDDLPKNLVGRTITFERDRIDIPGSLPGFPSGSYCVRPKYDVWKEVSGPMPQDYFHSSVAAYDDDFKELVPHLAKALEPFQPYQSDQRGWLKIDVEAACIKPGQKSASTLWWEAELTRGGYLAKYYTHGFLILKKIEDDKGVAQCDKARTPTEKAICANAKLKELDSQMAQAYHQAFARTAPKTAERQTLIQDQRKWLKSRDRCQADVACLSSAYRERIASLQAALPAKDQQVTP